MQHRKSLRQAGCALGITLLFLGTILTPAINGLTVSLSPNETTHSGTHYEGRETRLETNSGVEPPPYLLTPYQAHTLITTRDNVIILDVRDALAYSTGHLYSARLTPLFDLGCDDCLQQMLIHNPESTILMYGASTEQGTDAYTILTDHGFSEVYVLSGGFSAWTTAGYPISSAVDDQVIYRRINDSLLEGTPVFLMVYASWCQYSTHQRTILNAVQPEYDDSIDFVYVNAEDHLPIAVHFGVQTVPTMFLIVGRDDTQYYSLELTGVTEEHTLRGLFDTIKEDTARFVSSITQRSQKTRWVPPANTGYLPWFYYAREDINLANGNLYHTTTDIEVYTIGHAELRHEIIQPNLPPEDVTTIRVQRAYNSLNANLPGPLGYGWTHTYNVYLSIAPSSDVTLYTGDGAVHLFTSIGSGQYSPPAGIHERLTQTAGGYELRRTDGMVLSFNSTGSLLNIVDKNNNQLTLSYASHRLTSVTGLHGHSLSFTYDTSNRITMVTDMMGRQITYTYNPAGNLWNVTDAMGNTTQYFYDANHQLTTIVDRNGVATYYTYQSYQVAETGTGIYDNTTGNITQKVRMYSFTYATHIVIVENSREVKTLVQMNANGNPIQIINPLGGMTKMTWDASNNMLSLTNQNNNKYTYSYDSYGNMIQITNPLNETTQMNWTVIDSPTQYLAMLSNVVNRRNYSINMSHDAFGNLLTVQTPLGYTMSYSYDTSGNLQSITDPRGYTTGYAYNFPINQWTKTDALGNTTTYQYDIAGRLTSITDARGFTTTMTYDANNHLLSTTDALGNTTTHAYNAEGTLVSTTDRLGRTTQQGSNMIAVVHNETDAAGNTTSHDYDPMGNLLQTIDPNGHSTSYRYDALNRVTQMTDALGNTESYTYDAVGNLLSQTDKNGNTIHLQYDALNRPTVRIDPLGYTEHYVYDKNGNLISHTDKNTYTTAYVYDPLDRLITTVNPLGGSVQNVYDGNGNPVKTIDENNNIILRVFDPLNRVISSTDPAGFTKSYQYDQVGNLVNFMDKRGNSITYKYDALNRVIQQTDALGNIKKQDYDAVGNVLNITDERGGVTSFAYDTLDRLITLLDPLGYQMMFQYDATGNLIQETDKNGNIKTHVYDPLNRVMQTTDALGFSTWYTYDALGNVLGTTDANGYITSAVYDALNRKTQETNALGHSTWFAYDGMNNLLAITDANLHTTSYTYDALNRRTQLTTPKGYTIQYGYDNKANVLLRTDPDGRITTMTYDGLDRLTSEAYSTGGMVTYMYDPNDNLLFENQTGLGINEKLNYTYDAMNHRLTSTRNYGVFTTTIQYSYDAAGNQNNVIYPDGSTISRTHDAMNQLITLVDSAVGTTSFTYDAGGRRTSMVQPNGMTTSYGYDAEDHLLSLVHQKSDSTILSSYTYTYDGVGNRQSVTDQSSVTTTYQYDPVYQLTQMTDSVLGPISWVYDPVGNRLSETNLITGITTAYTYDEENRLLTEGAITYTYDQSGNRIAKQQGPSTTTYQYNMDNQLISTTLPSASTIQYTYGPDDTRSTRTAAGQTVYNLYDGDLLIGEYTPAGAEIARYTYTDNIDELISMRSAGLLYYYHGDVQGSITGLTDSTQTMVNTYGYDAFGNIIQTTISVPNPFTYSARELDSSIGLYYYRARMYDPMQGRFTSKDGLIMEQPFTKGDETNLYTYVGNNPVNYIDPIGYATWIWINGEWYSSDQYDLKSLREAQRIVSQGYAAANKLADELNAQWPKMQAAKKELEKAIDRGWLKFAFKVAGVAVAIAGIFTANPFIAALGISLTVHELIIFQAGASEWGEAGAQTAAEAGASAFLESEGFSIAKGVFEKGMGGVNAVFGALQAMDTYSKNSNYKKALEKAREANAEFLRKYRDGTWQNMCNALITMAKEKAGSVAEADKKKPPASPPVVSSGGSSGEGTGPTGNPGPSSGGGGAVPTGVTTSGSPGVSGPGTIDPYPYVYIPIDFTITNPNLQTMYNVTINNTLYDLTRNQSILLVIDESDGAHVWYEAALNATGAPYDKVFVDTEYTPVFQDTNASTKDLRDYDVVLWESSNDRSGTLQDPAQPELKKYLNASGCLFVGGEGVMHEWPQRTGTVMADYMFADGHEKDTYEMTVYGVPDTIGADLSPNLFGGSGSHYELFSSNIYGVKGTGVIDFLYDDGIAGIEGIGPWNENFTNATYKTVLFAFDFDAIEKQADRNLIMARILNFLDCQNGTGGPVPLSVPGGMPPDNPIPPPPPYGHPVPGTTVTPIPYGKTTTVVSRVTGTAGGNTVMGGETTTVEGKPDQTVITTTTFDDPANPGQCTDEGWTTEDLTTQSTYIHTDTYNAYSGTGYSWWVGSNGEPGWQTPPGYGDHWNQYLTLPAVDVTGATNPVLRFHMNIDTEEEKDTLTVEMVDKNTLEWVPMGQWSGTTGGWVESITIPVDPMVFGPQVDVRFHFQSNSRNSDEDGGYDSDGACYLDNIAIEDMPLPPTDFLIWEPDPTPLSGPALMSALTSMGYQGLYTTNLLDFPDLSLFQSVYVLLGIYSNNYLFTPGSAEEMLLVNYLNSGGNLYMEGGDVWAWDPEPSILKPYFNIHGLLDGYADLIQVQGVPGTFTTGMFFPYVGENNYIDRLEPVGPTATEIFFNPTASYTTAVSNEGGVYNTIGASFEFGGLEDSFPPSTKEFLAASYMEFFDIYPLARSRTLYYYNDGGDSPGVGAPPTASNQPFGNHLSLYQPGVLTPTGSSCEWAAIDPGLGVLPNNIHNALTSPSIDLSRTGPAAPCGDGDLFLYYDAYVDFPTAELDSFSIDISVDGAPWTTIRHELQGVFSRQRYYENLGPLDSDDVRLRFRIEADVGAHTPGFYLDNITITCTPPNNPPVLQPIGDRIGYLNQTLTIDVDASDPDNDPLTFDTTATDVIESLFSFNSATGLFTWPIPEYYEPGNYTIRFSVTDGKLWDNETIVITVQKANTPPEITSVWITPDPAYDDDTLHGWANATDADNDLLGYEWKWYINGLEVSSGVRDNYNISLVGHRYDTGDGYFVWNDGTYTYLANSWGGLSAYTFDGTSFSLVATATTSGDGYHVGVWGDGTYIYVANWTSGITAYTFSGVQFTKAGQKYNAGAAWNVWGDGTYLYLANYDDGLRAYTFDGTTFTLKGHIDNGGLGWGVWGDGTYLYLANYDDGLRAYTFNGITFTLKGSIDNGGNASGVWGDGTYLYLANDDDGVRAYTFDGTTFTNVGHIDDGGHAYETWGDGRYLYVANGDDGLRVYTFNGVTFTNVGYIDNGGIDASANGVVGDGTYIYLANGPDGLRAYSSTWGYPPGVEQNLYDLDETFTFPLDLCTFSCRAFDKNDSFSAWEDYSVVIQAEPALTLDVTVFLQGPYNGATMDTTLNSEGFLPLTHPYSDAPWCYTGTENVTSIPNADIVDWVLVELRDAPSASEAIPATMIAQQAAFLLNDGSIVGVDGTSLLGFDVTVSQNLFVVVWHRNHLGVMSAVPVVETGGVYTYDFTTGADQAYGGSLGHKQIGAGVWGMVGGDGNADGQVNNGDKNDVWSTQAGMSGYRAGDFDLNGQVQNQDKNEIWVPNSGRGCQVPDGSLKKRVL